MSRTQAVASSPPTDGITRNIDWMFDSSTGSQEVGAGITVVRNLISGVSGGTFGINLNNSGVTYQILNGRPVAAVSSGLGNGACLQQGFPIQGSQTVNANTPAAYGLRRGVTRFICTLASTTSEAPNNDVGMQFVIGGAGLAQLLPSTGAGAGKTGFGIWMLSNNGWFWATKQPTDLALALSDQVLIQANTGLLLEAEMRVFDSVPGGVAASNFARVELWINNLLLQTRYWVNPAGVVTPTLPPLLFALYPQIRNTSTGPAFMYAGNPSVIHGPNNSGTI